MFKKSISTAILSTAILFNSVNAKDIILEVNITDGIYSADNSHFTEPELQDRIQAPEVKYAPIETIYEINDATTFRDFRNEVLSHVEEPIDTAEGPNIIWNIRNLSVLEMFGGTTILGNDIHITSTTWNAVKAQILGSNTPDCNDVNDNDGVKVSVLFSYGLHGLADAPITKSASKS